MKVRRIAGSGFQLLDQFDLSLPETGTVLVTGDNGEGKSGLIEVVSASGWNKTLRGTPWWVQGEACAAELDTDVASIVRGRTKGGKNKVAFTHAEYDTATKAQPAIDAVLGSFDVWRKTSVFSASAVEGQNFSGGTDGERKRLIESIVGLAQFDAAFDRCSGARKKATGERDTAQSKREQEQALMVSADQRQADAAETLRNLTKSDDPQAKLKKLIDDIAVLQPDLDNLTKEQLDLRTAGNEQYAEWHGLNEKMGALADGLCPTCDREVDSVFVERLSQRLQDATTALAEAKAKATKDRNLVTAEIEELESDIADLRVQKRTVQATADIFAKSKGERQRLEKVVCDTALESTKHLLARTAASASANKLTKNITVLDAVYKVLGLKGVRAHILTHALQGLTVVTNKWLSRLADFTIDLSPYTELKSRDGVSDSIAINVNGAGGGYGYDACSTGQHRRIDIGIILGLATMASAAYGVEPGTLFLDEVFESLDPSGHKGVVSCLDELSRNRCVVVISHSASLQRYLNPVAHWHVEGGRVLEL